MRRLPKGRNDGKALPNARVAIIQPWLPEYRLSFFEELIRQSAEVGITVRIFHGQPPASMADRGDGVSANWATELPTKFFSFHGTTWNWKSLAAVRAEGPFDVVVVEQALRNLETYVIRILGGAKQVAFWGHGRTYTEHSPVFVEKLKQLLTRSGTWFFAYTSGGAKAVADGGFPTDRVTILNNSVDTATLSRDIAKLKPAALDSFKFRHGLTDRTALYIGALDTGKRLRWLVEAATIAHDLDASFRLLVVGDGPERPFVESEAETKGWLTYSGPLFGPDKALALAASKIISLPGRVGLVAVDSFAAARPIVTTRWSRHAPEFEYLTSDVNALISSDDVDEYGKAMATLLQDEERLDLLRRGCQESAAAYSVDNMAARFTQGLRKSLGR